MRPAVTAIIQARMDSSRLPGKVMLDLAGKPFIYHVIERAKAIAGVSRVVLATGKSKNNLPLVEIAKSLDIYSFMGSETNVLERFKTAAEKFGGDYIVRITGDNPFTDPEYASMAVDIAVESREDLCSVSNIPLGTAVEVIRRDALFSAQSMSSEPYQFEHVTPYIKEHPELFNIGRHDVHFDNPFENLRLTVDTAEDYNFVSEIYRALYSGSIIPLKDVIRFLKENPELLKINSGIDQRPMTHSSDEKN